jgi:two-component system CheB/CheR fusion protein
MSYGSREDLQNEINELRSQLAEAKDTIEAIRTGQVDALIVNTEGSNSLYTLRSADLAYRFFVEQMAEGAVTLNSDGLIIYSNSQFARIIKKPLSTIVGKMFSDLVIADNKSKFNNLFSESRTRNIKAEVSIESDDGVVHCQLSFSALLIDGENTRSMIVSDLTLQKEIEKELKIKNEELEKLNEALITSNHDLQQFASVASHDLQEPLRKIQVFSKFLKDRSYGELSDASKQYVEKIIGCAQRMKVLIVDILTYSRLSAGDPSFEMIDLNELVQEIVDDFDLKISEKNARIEVQELCAIEGNKGQIRQVFQNLISNALKFASSERAPSLAIQLKSLDARELGLSLTDGIDYCRIVVMDNGIGFDEKFSSSIFSLFETLNPKTTYEGSGIGLAIAKRIIDKHHGVIIAKSVIGRGSEFNVILPLRQPDVNKW